MYDDLLYLIKKINFIKEEEVVILNFNNNINSKAIEGEINFNKIWFYDYFILKFRLRGIKKIISKILKVKIRKMLEISFKIDAKIVIFMSHGYTICFDIISGKNNNEMPFDYKFSLKNSIYDISESIFLKFYKTMIGFYNLKYCKYSKIEKKILNVFSGERIFKHDDWMFDRENLIENYTTDVYIREINENSNEIKKIKKINFLKNNKKEKKFYFGLFQNFKNSLKIIDFKNKRFIEKKLAKELLKEYIQENCPDKIDLI